MPVATAQTVTLNEDTNKTVTLSGTDADGDTLRYIIVTRPAHGRLSGTAPNLTYTPDADYHGSDSFTFKVNDTKADSAVATVNITVNDVNDAPVADAGADKSTTVNTAVTLSGSGSDRDGTIASYQWREGNTVLGNSATLTYTPTTEGTHTLTLTVTDDDGATASDTVVVTATPVPLTTIAQAILGPISEASYSIRNFEDVTPLFTGETTAGDGSDISTAGLIRVQQSALDAVVSGLYLIEVTGGMDIDEDDDTVWDEYPVPNRGTLHALITDQKLKQGGFKVNILTEVIYLMMKEPLSGGMPPQVIQHAIDERAKSFFKDVSDGGVMSIVTDK